MERYAAGSWDSRVSRNKKEKTSERKSKSFSSKSFYNGKKRLEMLSTLFTVSGGEKRNEVARSSCSSWGGFTWMQYGKQPKTLPYVRNKVFTSHRISPRKIGRQDNNSGQKSSRLDHWVRWHSTKATKEFNMRAKIDCLLCSLQELSPRRFFRDLPQV